MLEGIQNLIIPYTDFSHGDPNTHLLPEFVLIKLSEQERKEKRKKIQGIPQSEMIYLRHPTDIFKSQALSSFFLRFNLGSLAQEKAPKISQSNGINGTANGIVISNGFSAWNGDSNGETSLFTESFLKEEEDLYNTSTSGSDSSPDSPSSSFTHTPILPQESSKSNGIGAREKEHNHRNGLRATFEANEKKTNRLPPSTRNNSIPKGVPTNINGIGGRSNDLTKKHDKKERVSPPVQSKPLSNDKANLSAKEQLRSTLKNKRPLIPVEPAGDEEEEEDLFATLHSSMLEFSEEPSQPKKMRISPPKNGNPSASFRTMQEIAEHNAKIWEITESKYLKTEIKEEEEKQERTSDNGIEKVIEGNRPSGSEKRPVKVEDSEEKNENPAVLLPGSPEEEEFEMDEDELLEMAIDSSDSGSDGPSDGKKSKKQDDDLDYMDNCVSKFKNKRTHNCGLCEESYGQNDKQRIRYHALWHCIWRAYQCPYCEYRHFEIGKIRRHLSSVHKDDVADPTCYDNRLISSAPDVYLKRCFPHLDTGKLQIGRLLNYPNMREEWIQCLICKEKSMMTLAPHHIVDKHEYLHVFSCEMCAYQSAFKLSMSIHYIIEHLADLPRHMNTVQIDYYGDPSHALKSAFPDYMDAGGEANQMHDRIIAALSPGFNKVPLYPLMARHDGLEDPRYHEKMDIETCVLCLGVFRGRSFYELFIHSKTHMNKEGHQWACPELDSAKKKCSFTAGTKFEVEVHRMKEHGLECEGSPINKTSLLQERHLENFNKCFPRIMKELQGAQ